MTGNGWERKSVVLPSFYITKFRDDLPSTYMAHANTPDLAITKFKIGKMS